MSKDTGGPAFPAGAIRKTRQRPNDPGSDFVVSDMTEPRNAGMTLRDYFAAKAMPKAWDDWKEYCKSPEGSNGELIFPGECVENIADDAYLMADAMLEARK